MCCPVPTPTISTRRDDAGCGGPNDSKLCRWSAGNLPEGHRLEQLRVLALDVGRKPLGELGAAVELENALVRIVELDDLVLSFVPQRVSAIPVDADQRVSAEPGARGCHADERIRLEQPRDPGLPIQVR